MIKDHGPRLPRVPASRLQFRRVHPALLRPLKPFRRDVAFRLPFRRRKPACRERINAACGRLVRGDLGRRFGDDPVLGAAGDFAGGDFDEAAAFDGEEVARGQHFDVYDWEYSVVDFVVMDFARDAFFAHVVDVLVDCFVDDGGGDGFSDVGVLGVGFGFCDDFTGVIHVCVCPSRRLSSWPCRCFSLRSS